MSMTNIRIAHCRRFSKICLVNSDGLSKQTDTTMASNHSSHTEEFRSEVKLCLNWYYVFTAAWEGAGVSVNRCEAEFPIPEPSCHLSFSAKSQELNEWFPCSCLFFSGYLPSLLLGSSTFLLHSLIQFPHLHLTSCSKQTNEWVTPGSR